MNQVSSHGFDYDGLPRSFVRAARKRRKRIMELDQETGRNVIEMGLLLKEQRDAFGGLGEKTNLRGTDTWDSWVKQECGWSSGRSHANRLIKISDKFAGVETTPAIGFEIMKQLSSDTTPDELVKKVVEMAKNGQLPTIKKVRDMKKEAAQDTRPTPTDAKAQAQKTGEIVIGSDDKIYTPLPEDQAEQYQERRDQTYGAIDAINEIAATDISPKKWLEQAEKHWLNDLSLPNVEQANDWLINLIVAYKRREKIVDG